MENGRMFTTDLMYDVTTGHAYGEVNKLVAATFNKLAN